MDTHLSMVMGFVFVVLHLLAWLSLFAGNETAPSGIIGSAIGVVVCLFFAWYER